MGGLAPQGRVISMERTRFVADMLDWLNRKFAPDGVMIREDTPLFADGLINSIRILELIAWTERAIGGEIPDLMIRMDNFHTVERIADVFLGEEQHVAA
jgi:acyl carrier protein